jgi:hypothetical protein
MSGSAELQHRLNSAYSVYVPKKKDSYLDVWSNTTMVNGAHRECYPGWKATPIGDSPYGFLVCEREENSKGVDPEIAFQNNPAHKPKSQNNFVPYSYLEKNSGAFYSQSYDLYNNKPAAEPRVSMLGGPALAFPDRRLPFSATLQGGDYYRDSIKWRGTGIEHLDAYPGDYGYDENKYYYSAPPPVFDVTQSVQPYEIWRREQVRMGTLTRKELSDFERVNTYKQKVDAF